MSNETQITIRPAERAGDLGWIVMANAETYANEYGWDASFETLAVQIVSDYAQTRDPSRESAWVAELDGRRVGCVMCVTADPVTAQLRMLLVDRRARGRGVGSRLVGECLAFARDVGYTRMKLWTNDPLVAARHVYLAHGFRLVERDPHHSFGVDLVGETYELELHPAASAGAA
jgi:GNAT superfamily N-acetyltransferase